MKEILNFDLCGYSVNQNGVFDDDGDLVAKNGERSEDGRIVR